MTILTMSMIRNCQSLENISDALVMPKLVVVRVPTEDIHKSSWSCINCLKSLITFSLAFVLLAAASGGWCYWAFNMLVANNYKMEKLQLHSVLMTIGLITVNGFSIISYRIFKCVFRWNIKLAHAFMQTAVLVVIGFGGYEAILFHEHSKLGHLISLHGQIGTLTLILYSGQFVMGMISFMCFLICEKVTDTARADFIPFHAALGRTIFLFSVLSWVTGLSQALFWITNLGTLSNGDMVAVACCWVIILLAIVCTHILTTERLRYTSHIGQIIRD